MYLFKVKAKQSLEWPITDPGSSKRLNWPDFETIGTWRWQGYQPNAPAAFAPMKYLWYLFLLEAESVPDPHCGRKDYVN